MNILSMKESNRITGLILNAGKKLDERIHNVAVSGLAHWYTSGDNTILTNLVKAMPKSGRGNALKYWISEHSNNGLKWDKKAHNGTGGYKGKKPELKGFTSLCVVLKADSKAFHIKEDREPTVWNDKNSVLSLVAKLKKHSIDHDLCEEGQKIVALFA